jgi:hypothetical protein
MTGSVTHRLLRESANNNRVATCQNEQRKLQDCSVFLILVLAFVDGAFRDFSTPEELFRIKPLHDKFKVIPFRDGVMDDFVLKSKQNNALSDNVFRNNYRPMVQRAGYKVERMKLYNIRRFVANKVNGETCGILT